MNIFFQRTKAIATTVVVTTTVAFSGHAPAATLDISDVPLFLQAGVQPNLILAIDDSGSMDFEVLLPGNDGAAWFRHGNSDSCVSTDDNSFVGCIANGTADVAAPGKVNFNNDGNASGIWEKFPYLFPNGTDGGNSSFKRRQPPGDHYAIPPFPSLAWTRSPDHNTAYFDPTEVYSPWRNHAGQTFSAASFTAARFDPVYGSNADAINLSLDVAHRNGSVIRQVSPAADCNNAQLGNDSVDEAFSFRVFKGMTIPDNTCIRLSTGWEKVNDSNCQVAEANGCDLDSGNNRTISADSTGTNLPIRYFPATFWLSSALPASYGYLSSATLSGGKAPNGTTLIGYEIKPGNFSASTDPDTGVSYSATANYNRMAQNFANWFTYYRKRHQALRAGLGESFKDISGLRVDSFTINDTTPDVTVSDIGGTGNRDALLLKFYQNSTGNGGTPNRMAVANTIKAFQSSSGPIKFACQKNFGMLFTDGFTTPGTDFDTLGNVDGSLAAPFKDNVPGTMADGVLNAYIKPLRTDLPAGKVSIPLGCPAVTLDCNKNLHMNFYAVTLGTRGLLFDPEATPPQNPFLMPPTWPSVFPQRHPSAVDDLWHATINGRGQLLNARRPADISKQLSAVLEDIVKKTSSASSASVNSGSISSDTRVFQAKFDSSAWGGQLQSFLIDGTKTDGSLLKDAEWDAATKLPDAIDRKIITVNSNGVGVAFKWANLDATRKAQIEPNYLTDSTGLGNNRVNYLRGDDSLEAGMKDSLGKEIGIFRKRPTKLGDIISSSPLFVGKPPYFYPDTLETGGLPPTADDETYSKFRLAKKQRERKDMVYAGANDGMLHGFDAVTGVELLAFIPSPAYGNLRRLSDLNYNANHKFLVDGAANSRDVFYDKKWHTVLVGGLNKGGQGIYALDITDPDAFANTGNADSIVLWEFTDANDKDLGFTYSQPAIVRLQTGVWAAVFGNGYSNTTPDSATSTSGTAALYMVNIETGALIRKFNTFRGTAAKPNGLSTPSPVDIDGDNTTDFIYAGDLLGNLWKFDISSKNSADWRIDYGTTPISEAAPVPLFTTQSTGSPSPGTPQPITGRVEVIRGPKGIGTMVLFGTGKYLENSDKIVLQTNKDTQSYYGIIDRNTHGDGDVVTFGMLTQQSIIAEQTTLPKLRVTSDTKVIAAGGWYMNLTSPTAGFQGERQVSNTTVRAKRVIFTTLIPDTDPCSGGGTSFVMQLNALTGGRLDQTPFDVNRDGLFDSSDMVTVNIGGVDTLVAASGTDVGVGIVSDPGILSSADGTKEFQYFPGTSSDIGVVVGNPGPRATGRQSWRQIR